MELFLLCCSLKKQKAKKDLDVVEEWVKGSNGSKECIISFEHHRYCHGILWKISKK